MKIRLHFGNGYKRALIFNVCGDASKMAKDVEQALLDVIAKEGNLSSDEAEDYLNELREVKRYQRDVY